MAISDDFTIDYTNRLIYHSSGSTVYSINQLYSWLMDNFDESDTIDDTIPMTAQTPTAYSLVNGWYIIEFAYTSFNYLNGGSIKSLGHDAAAYSYGIRKKAYDASGAGTPFGTSDIGQTITETDTGNTGTILDYDTSLGTDQGYVYLRPDTSGDVFADTNSTYTVSSSSASGSFTAASVTGQNFWTNIYTIGSLVANTQIYLYQNNIAITPWWSSGHIDILIKTKDAGTQIDEGLVTIYAREYATLYDNYIADLSSGSRTPIPLATFTDTNNTSGDYFITASGVTGTFDVGNFIYAGASWATATVKAVLTYVSGANLTYYLIGDLTNFTGDAITEWTGTADDATATSTSNPPTAIGPAALSPAITITFSGAISQDLGNGNGSRPYDVAIDLSDTHSVATLYEFVKYVTRRGYTSDIDSGTLGLTLPGENYQATGELYLTYTTGSGTLTEGNTVTGDTSGATGTIVSNHTSIPALVIRDVAGTFVDGENLTEGANTGTNITVEDIAASKQSPFGTFAGGKFFGARGVWLANVPATSANSYQLIDSTNTSQVPPQTIAITVSGLQAGDRVSIFRTTGDNETIDRQLYTSDASANTSGHNTFVVQEAIETDTPNSGYLRVIDNSLNREQRYQYDSWSGSTFTLHTGVTLNRNYEATDTAYVPYIDETASGTSASASITYSTDRYVLTVVRIAGVQPFKVKGQITTNGLSVTAVRATDTVYQ